jgi:histidinol dehydrogenase
MSAALKNNFFSPIENHREREKGVLVYPVYSRRSGGLSVGINLYPDKKHCQFDCPYCEIFPFSNQVEFSIEQMEKDLRFVIKKKKKENIPIQDICFSGNGEPSLSPDFPEALNLAGCIQREIAQAAELVLITNGTGLFSDRIFSLLKTAVINSELNIWLKLDAGTEDWYKEINRSKISFKDITEKIKEFTACAPVTIQTMLCVIDGKSPPLKEAQAWVELVTELALGSSSGGGLRKVQIYGKARPSPEDPKTSALSIKYLEERAVLLKNSISKIIPIEIYP